MSKEKKGHEREAYGYKLTTSLEANGWAVQIVPKPRSRGGGKGEARPVHGVDKDGFAFEGEALDWAEDWATTNRVYSVEVNSKDHGVAAEVMDDSGVTLWTSAVCAEASEARNRADTFIRARRAHDQEVLKARQANRANYRLLLDDERAKEEKAKAAIEAAKSVLKSCDAERARLAIELRSPQVVFNFIDAIEQIRDSKAGEAANTILSEMGLKGTKDPHQSDVEDYARGKKPPPRPGAQT